MASTRAAMLVGPRELSVADIEMPEPESGEVSVRVEACGICGSDLAVWSQGRASALHRPGVQGHEIAATVARIGDGVDRLGVGDLVCIEPIQAFACGDCGPCRAGLLRFCRSPRRPAAWGFAEQMVVPAGAIRTAPPTTNASLLTLTEPLACATHGLRRADAARRDGRLDGLCVAVLGAGAIGLLTVFAARQLGARATVVAARHQSQADLAWALGVDEVLMDTDPADETSLATNLTERAPDVIVLAAGGEQPLIRLATSAVAPGGEVVVLGMLRGEQALSAAAALRREIRVSFAFGYDVTPDDPEFDLSLAWLVDNPTLITLVTQAASLDDIQSGFELAAGHRGQVRVVVRP
jgi:threonine dehydrogenase-like Zn-dependent dehydrogenase